MNTIYQPQYLKRWSLPDSYFGATWEGYFVAPVTRHRDSDLLTESNWSAQWETLKGFSEDVPEEDCTSPTIVTENHWAVGWVEWVAIHESNAPALEAADRLAEQLESYPVLNEYDWSNREHEEYEKSWLEYGCLDFLRALRDAFGLRESTWCRLEDADPDKARDLFESLIPSGDFYHGESSGVSIHCDVAANACGRDQIAKFLRSIRKD